MSRVAIASCRGDNPDVDAPFLIAALADLGVAAELIAWDEPGVDWESFDLTVLRSTWDYAPRREEFLAWAAERPRLLNPVDVVTYSTDKHYLLDLEARGVPVVPSWFCEVGDVPVFPEGDFVVKPAVGAGSFDAARYRPQLSGEARCRPTWPTRRLWPSLTLRSPSASRPSSTPGLTSWRPRVAGR